MSVLGIDYGLSKIGLAIAYSNLAEPYCVIKYKKDLEDLFAKIKEVIVKEDIQKIVVGKSESLMADKSTLFAKFLAEKLNIDIEMFDETLSTYEAQEKSRQAGIKRKKRKSLEDAYAAAIMLQSYLDNSSE